MSGETRSDSAARLQVFSVITGLVLLPSARPVGAQPPADLELLPVVSGLTRPVEIRHAEDGTDRLFIVEQAGVIRVVEGSRLLPTPFLDITALVYDAAGEQGLLGLAFHPDYPSSGWFYVNYTRHPASGLDRTLIARYRVSTGNPNVADPASATPLLEIEQDFGNHNGGGIAFGPDGYLYIGMGDGGSGGDPNNRAQDKQQLLGKMLRIDVDGGGEPADCGLVGQYTVPATNPLRDGPGGDCDEIWAGGLRNPWRWSFDRLTGDLFIGDVGQAAFEEVDFEPAASGGGRNYGWRCYEASADFNLTGCGPQSQYTFPILEYPHLSGPGCTGSVTGGYVYRGSALAGLHGAYVYGDFCTGRIWFATRDGAGWSTTLWRETGLRITAFGVDRQGELYLAEIGGTIYRFVSSIFTDGFESGSLEAWPQTVP